MVEQLLSIIITRSHSLMRSAVNLSAIRVLVIA